MGHQHAHSPSPSHATGNISVAFFLNLGFTVIELAGGLFTNSVAILSDALHDLGDSLSLGLAWYFQKLSGKGRDRKYSYGYSRFSVLGAVINSIVLITGSIFILTEAIPRLQQPETADARGMFLLSLLGILFNGIAVWRLRKGESLNERVVSLHLLEDVLGWVAVLIGSVVMFFFDLPIIDPALSILIAGYILFNVYKNLKGSLKIILQATPSDVGIDQIQKVITSLEDIQSIHDVHVWSLDGQYNILTFHAVLSEEKNSEALYHLKNRIREETEKLNIHHATIEFERDGEECRLQE